MSDLNFKLSSVADSSYAGVHHVSNLLPFQTWGRDTQVSQSDVALAAEPSCVDSAVELLEGEEEPEYGFDFLFVGDDGQGEPLAAADSVPPSWGIQPFLAITQSAISGSQTLTQAAAYASSASTLS